VFSRYIGMLIMALLLTTVSPHHLRAQESGVQTGPPVPQVADITYDIHDYPGPPDRIPSLAHDLVYLKKGQPFSQGLLDSSLSLLRLSGRFEDASAETRETPEGMRVVFHLKPYLLIRDIRISGEYPLFEQDILTAMTASVGGYLQPGTPASQEELIARFLTVEGFIHPRVAVTVLRDGKDGTAVLGVKLDKGPVYRLESLTLTGNRQFSDTRLKTRMSLWMRSFFRGSSGRFIEKNLTDDAKNLASFYWSRGYADAQVAYSVQKDKEDGKVRVLVDIKEGPLYKVAYEGRERFYAFTLNKQLTLFKEGNRGGGGVRKSARNIRDLYLISGFPDARVKTRVETGQGKKGEERRVLFIIDEGSRAVVENVDFSGNTAYESKRLARKIETGKKTYPVLGKKLFSRDVLDQDIQTITSLYQSLGYESADVGAVLNWSPDKKKVSVLFRITEGVQTMVVSVAFEGVTAITLDEARSFINLKEGRPFSPAALKSGETSLAAHISEEGYPNVEVHASADISKDGKTASVKYAVNEGRLVYMGNTYFNGNFKTRNRILRRELDMEPGGPFSLSKMVKGQNGIRDMNVFNSVKFKTLGLKENQDKVTVVADLEEKKPYYTQASFGYESSTGMYGNARIGDHNFLGLNRDVWLGAEMSEVNERYELGVNAPRLLGTHVAGVYNLFWEKREDFNQNFGLRTTGYSVGLVERFGPKVFAALNLKYEKRNEYIIDEDLQEKLDQDKTPEELADEEDTLKPRSIVVVSPSVTYDSRDNFLHPKKGIFSLGALDFSHGLMNSQDVDNFIRYRLDVREYVTPVDRLTFAWMVKVGYIMSTNSMDVLPDDQLFYLGGTLNVRGYRENMLLYDENGSSVGGRFSLASSIEARIAVIDGIEVPLFFDIGVLHHTNAASVVPETRASYGTGVRYITPIGPISLVYGRKLRPEPEESPYEWHFSVGYTF
jgi:outer membrane protein insertion porin family